MTIRIFTLAFITISTLFLKTYGQQSGFVDEPYVAGINQPVGLNADPAGKFFVYTKSGRVYLISNGVLNNTPILDINLEVFDYVQVGLLNMILDPNYATNGYIYFYYATDLYYEKNNNLPSYDPAQLDGGGAWWPIASFGRVARFTVTNPLTANPSIDIASKVYLVGETISTGVPITAYSHAGGAMAFGKDGTLMLVTGDGAANGEYPTGDTGSNNWSAYQQAIDEGIMTPAENIGMLRSIQMGTLGGKALRIDPTNGNGISSNPLFDATNPRSANSRFWGTGFRNPFNARLIPSTGSTNPIDGNPGKFMLCDVGRDHKEEITIIDMPNRFFGWPKYEGIDVVHPWAAGIADPYTYVKPIIDYRDSQGRTWKNGQLKNIGRLASEVNGMDYIAGSCVGGGEFYTKTDFPSTYLNSYFWLDYDSRKINYLKLDNTHQLESIENFSTSPRKSLGLCFSPTLNGLYYISGAGELNAEIRRIRYSPGNLPPLASITSNQYYGPSPLTVLFNSSNSYDPEGQALTYSWNFGDGTPLSTLANPTHIYTESSNIKRTATLTLTDVDGNINTKSIDIYINNSPPQILSSTLDNVNTIPFNQPLSITLFGNVTDAQTPTNLLTYQWLITLQHSGHEHIQEIFSTNSNTTNTTLSAIQCEAGQATYWYRAELIVTDPQGLKATYTKDILPICNTTTQAITFNPLPDVLNTSLPITLNATASSGLPIIYYVLEGPASVIGNVLTLNGTPGKVVLRAVQNGNASFDPALPKEVSFQVNFQGNSYTSNSGWLKVELESPNSVYLKWNFNNYAFSSYKIYQNNVLINTVSGGVSQLLISGLIANSTYVYEIKGVNGATEIASSKLTFVMPTITCGTTGLSNYVSDMPWNSVISGGIDPQRNLNIFQNPLLSNGVSYPKGIGVFSGSEIEILINGQYELFKSKFNLDDAATSDGDVKFQVWADGAMLYESPLMDHASLTDSVTVNITGKNSLTLKVDNNGNGYFDIANWLNTRISTNPCISDKTAPILVQNLFINNVTANSFTTNWVASDNVGVVKYEVFYDNLKISTITNGTTSFTQTGVTNGTHTILIQAIDAAGNTSVTKVYSLTFGTPCPSVLNITTAIAAPVNLQSSGTTTISAPITASSGLINATATNHVLLLPGFKTNSTTVFKAQIANCTN